MRNDVARLIAFPLLAVVSGCVPAPSEPDITVWSAQLTPAAGYPGLSGEAGAVSDLNGTDATILIEGAEPGAVHTWHIRSGSCANPQERLGPASDYPDLQVGLQGSATADTRLGPRLNSAGTYHVEVQAGPDDASRITCGNLVRD